MARSRLGKSLVLWSKRVILVKVIDRIRKNRSRFVLPPPLIGYQGRQISQFIWPASAATISVLHYWATESLDVKERYLLTSFPRAAFPEVRTINWTVRVSGRSMFTNNPCILKVTDDKKQLPLERNTWC